MNCGYADLKEMKQYCLLPFEPAHDKIDKMTFTPSKDADQPGHPPSLIRVFDVRGP